MRKPAFGNGKILNKYALIYYQNRWSGLREIKGMRKDRTIRTQGQKKTIEQQKKQG